MSILSLDQASNTGWAYYDNNQILNFGIIESDTKLDYDTRVAFIKNEVKKLVKKHRPILVTIEGAQFQGRNVLSYHNLSKLQGVLINYFLENNILFDIIPSTKWRSGLGIKGRKKIEIKANAIAYVHDVCGIDTNEDTSEAICMALYASENIKIITQN